MSDEKIKEESKESKNPTPKTPKIKIKKPPAVFEKSQELIKQLTQIIGCPLLIYYKPYSSNIWAQDLYAIRESLNRIGKVKKLAVFIRSDGGSGLVSMRIIHLLRDYVEELVLLAPAECASAATMLALGCDEIQMGPLSCLSPVDTSLVHSLSPVDKSNNKVSISLDELGRVIKLWEQADTQAQSEHKKYSQIDPSTDLTVMKEGFDNPYKYLYQYIHPLVFGSVDRNSSLSKKICHEILGYHIKDKKLIESITNRLNDDYPAHGYPITDREAKKLGLPVTRLSNEALNIMNELQLLYGSLCTDQITDFDKFNYHDNSILSVVESDGIQTSYFRNYDREYLETEKRYIIINDLSGWSKTSFNEKNKLITSKIFF